MRPDLIIFDCDGVLIDSESVASAVVAANLTAHGWPMTAPQAMQYFMGMSIFDMQPLIEKHLGCKLPASWRAELAEQLIAALGTQSKLIPGAKQMLERVNALGIPWRVASNSSEREMQVKFVRCGIAHLTKGRTHSAASVIAKGGRAKPAPDLFLAAATAAATPPQKCLVLEDSVPGVTGAVAAAMGCYGFAPHGTGENLLAAGATAVLHNLDELFGVLA